MSAFTDGTLTGNTLSMVDMKKRLESLPTTEKVNELINQAITKLLNSGDVAVNGTQFKVLIDNKVSDFSKWNEYTYTAKESGWYCLYCLISNKETPAAYIKVGSHNSHNKEARINGNGSRDICAGPIWVKAGETISFGCVYVDEYQLQLTTREA